MRRLISYRVKLLLSIALLLCFNIITISVLYRYDGYGCIVLKATDKSDNSDSPDKSDKKKERNTLTRMIEASKVKKSQKNGLSTEFIRSNYLNTKMHYEYEISHELIDSKEISNTYEYDPRFTLGIYLNHITSKLEAGNSDPIPFSWYDFVNISKLNGFIELSTDKKFTCQDLCIKEFPEDAAEDAAKDAEERETKQTKKKPEITDMISPGLLAEDPDDLKLESEIYELPDCQTYCHTDTSPNQPGFRIYENHSKGRANVKTLHALSYLYSEAPNPLDMVIVNEKGNLQVPIKSNEQLVDKQQLNMMNSGLFKEYVKKYADKINILEVFNDLQSTNSLKKADDHIDFKSYRYPLQHERFLFDGPEYLKLLKSSPSKSSKDDIFINAVQNSLNVPDKDLSKYFSEVKLIKEPHILGYHYDWRFFTGKRHTLDENHAILSRMLKTWFQLTSNEGIVSWVAHGGLLSYSFNGVNFPWDDDSDVQMPYVDFVEFSRKFNQSIILENPEDGLGVYFIDVGDSITHRVKGKGENNIDARMVDVHSGVFIDITALAVSGTNLPVRYVGAFNAIEDKDIKFRDPNHPNDEDILKKELDDMARFQNAESPEAMIENLKAKLPKEFNLGQKMGLSWNKNRETRYDINYKLQIYNCRNNHFYQLNELSPLRLSYFEKVQVLIPNDIPTVLSEEYRPQPLLFSSFFHDTFVPQLRMWVPNGYLSSVAVREKTNDNNLIGQDDILELLKEDFVLERFSQIWDSSLLNEKERMIIRDDHIENKDELLGELLIGRKFNPIMKDPFITELEKANPEYESINKDSLKKEMYEKMSNQMILEFKHEVDFSNIGTIPKEMTNNFNIVSTDLKKLLNKYVELKYSEDSERKVKEFLISIGTPVENEKLKTSDLPENPMLKMLDLKLKKLEASQDTPEVGNEGAVKIM